MKKSVWKKKKVWLMIVGVGITLATSIGYQVNEEATMKIVNQVIEILDVLDVLE